MQYSYTTLKAAIIDYLTDTGAAFASALDIIIPLSEDRILRDLDLTIFDTIASGTFSAGSPLVTKPTGCLATRDIIYVPAAGGRNPLMQRDFSFVLDYWPDETVTTTLPKYFAEYSATQWYVGGTPGGSNTFTTRIMKRPVGLSGSNDDSWLGTNVGDLLFYACLITGAEYLKTDERLTVWAQEYTSRLSAAKADFWNLRRQKYMPVASIPVKVQEKE